MRNKALCIRFTKYCKEGKIELVKKWMNDPSVNMEWNNNEPLREVIINNHYDIFKLLLNNDHINVDYEWYGEIKSYVTMVGAYERAILYNPFTVAMINSRFDMMTLFIEHNEKHNEFNVFRKEYLQLLLLLDNKQMNLFFLKINGMLNFIMSFGDEFIGIITPEAVDIFLF